MDHLARDLGSLSVFSDDDWEPSLLASVANEQQTRINDIVHEGKALLLHPGGVNVFFQAIDPETHTISYITALRTLFSARMSDGPFCALDLDDLRACLRTILQTFHPVHVRFVGDFLRELLEATLQCDFWPASVCVSLVANALLRLDPDNHVFTSVHSKLYVVAHRAGCGNEILPFVRIPTTLFAAAGECDRGPLIDPSLPPAAYMRISTGFSQPLTAGDVLDGTMAAAMILVAARDWKGALAYLERCVAYPARSKSISPIMVTAYKRWMLVSLLVHGEMSKLPSLTSHLTAAAYGQFQKPYGNLITFFSEPDAAKKLNKEANKGAGVWQQDGNTALVGEVLDAYQKWQVIKLRGVYSTIPVASIRRTIQSARTGGHLATDEEVVAVLREMIDSGMVEAELRHGPINHGVGHHSDDDDDDSSSSGLVLHFPVGPLDISEAELAASIAKHQKIILAAKQALVQSNDILAEHPERVNYLLGESRRAERTTAINEMIPTDEDLMT